MFDTEGFKRLHDRCYSLAEQAAELPLDELVAHLDALEATGGHPLGNEERAFCRNVQGSLRAIVVPLRDASTAFIRLEQFWKEQIATGKVP